jgi:hypothetical protein
MGLSCVRTDPTIPKSFNETFTESRYESFLRCDPRSLPTNTHRERLRPQLACFCYSGPQCIWVSESIKHYYLHLMFNLPLQSRSPSHDYVDGLGANLLRRHRPNTARFVVFFLLLPPIPSQERYRLCPKIDI